MRITRTRTIKTKTSREAAYLVIPMPTGHAQPADLAYWARREWHVENLGTQTLWAARRSSSPTTGA